MTRSRKTRQGVRRLPFKLFTPRERKGRGEAAVSVGGDERSDAAARQKAKRILERYGSAASDYFKLWPDKSHFFSESGESVVSYCRTGRVVLALGDPVGPEDELAEVVRSFVDSWAGRRHTVAFHQITTDLLPVYADLKFSEIKIGEEAIVDIGDFLGQTAATGEFARVRRKFSDRGFEVVEAEPPHSHDLLDSLELISRDWLSIPGRRERTFSLGFFHRDYLNTTPVVLLRDPEGKIIAFVNRVPCFADGDATIDLMRHRLEVPNGTMDFMFLRLMEILRENGHERFSLGIAPMAGVGEEPGASIEEQAIRVVINRMNRIFSFKGLKNYKSKFNPVWRDRHLAYRGGPYGLLRVGAALIRATSLDSPEEADFTGWE